MGRVDIADYLGLRGETISRVLQDLVAKGVIEIPSAPHIIIKQRERLEELAEEESGRW